ncbi:MAG: type II secretion system F family protein [Geminicoccaceae bacterium]
MGAGLIVQAGLGINPSRAFLVLVAIALMVAVLLALMGFGLLMVIGGAIALGILLPVLILNLRRGSRIDQLGRQMPDAIDLMVRSLRAGFPLAASFQVIAREMSDPIGTEMGLISDAITYGDDLTDAVIDFADRVDIEEARYLAVAINIQAGTGGNLAGVLDALSKVIRERFAMQRKIKAVSSEAKLSAWVVSAAPVLIFGALQLVAPSYYGDVADHPLYDVILGIGLVLTIINALVLRRLVRFHF